MSKKLNFLVPEIVNDFRNGKMNRREFLRFSTLLGVSTVTAAWLGGFTSPPGAFAAAPKRGGVIKMSSKLGKITHPARFSWVMPSNVVRQVCEYLTFFGADNLVKPYLLESWEVSEDLKTWTLNLRQGVTWNNGDAFTAEDVVFTFNQWLDRDLNSFMLRLLGGYLDSSGVEKVNDHQVKLHLNKPQIAVPEHLFHYPAVILNARTFEGDFLKAPVGTGPFTLESYAEGEAAVFKARKDYWQKGADGKSLPYVDGVKILDLGIGLETHIAALKSGQVHLVDNSELPGPQLPSAVKGDPGIVIEPVATSATRVLRMRADTKPFDDNRVRLALKLCQNRKKTLALAYQNDGLQGQDVHVHPNHPDYCKIPTPRYNPQKARALLAEAGYTKGFRIDLAVGADWPEVVRYAELLKQDAEAGGFDITIKTMPSPQYWEKWTEVLLGITPWPHWPLGAMMANLAYSGDAEGKPAPWNETRWVDKEYNELISQANGTLDIEKRRKLFCKIESIQQKRGSIGIAFWMNTWACPRKELKGIQGHPNQYYMFGGAWLDA